MNQTEQVLVVLLLSTMPSAQRRQDQVGLLQEVHVRGYSPSGLASLLVIRPPVEIILQKSHLEVQGNWGWCTSTGSRISADRLCSL